MDHEPTFAVIGAGMSGIASGVKLQQRGHDFTIFEKAATVGGTWRENTYPGIACDVPSHIYSYSFDLNPEWSYLCSPGAEIQEYFERITDKYDLRPQIRFEDPVVSCVWSEDDRRWTVTGASGHTVVVDFVIAATGILHHPSTPAIDGLDTFGGHLFHSARWDHTVELDGKRIGLIGTGSTGVQITGALADVASELKVFMRTAQWVAPVDQVAYSEDEKNAWRTDADLLKEMHESMQKEFNDGFATSVLDGESDLVSAIAKRCTDYLDTQIADPELREMLRPDYTPACKRLVVSHNFYDAVQKPAVTVIPGQVERIDETGIVDAAGVHHDLDIIVMATGFHVDRFLRPMTVAGRDGVLLDDAWTDRPSAYLSVTVPGFPNLFMLNGPNSPVGNFSLIQTAELQLDYSLGLVDMVGAGQLTVAAPVQALKLLHQPLTASQ